jgi:hypothetical protein
VASARALGRGDVRIAGGTLAINSATRIQCGLRLDGGVLGAYASLTVDGRAVLGGGVLELGGRSGLTWTLRAGSIRGRFARVRTADGVRAEVFYTRTAVTVRLR